MTAAGTSQPAGAMSVPMLDLQAQYRPIRDQILDAVTRVCDSQRFIMGPEVEGLERELAALLGVKHAVGVSSGTDALLLAMMALGIGPGDEVITSTYSFFATAGCVARLGATPVFVDIDPVTYNIDPAAVAAAITPRTKAIIPVHLYGQSADMDPIAGGRARARAWRSSRTPPRRSARATRAAWSAAIGRAGCFSFFPSKNLGRVRRRRPRHDERRRRWPRRCAACACTAPTGSTTTSSSAANFRLDALQAAVLRVKLPHLAAWTEARRRNAARYDALFAEARAGRIA